MLHALVRRVLADLVVHQEENPGPDLNGEEEERDAAQVVPDRRVGADGYFLVSQERDEARELEPLVEHPKNLGPDGGRGRRGIARVAHAMPPGLLTLTTPLRSPSTVNAARGRGGGPEITRPSRENFPLWQAHQMIPSAGTNCTVHPSCVHLAESALSFCSLSFRSRTRSVPHRAIRKPFAESSCFCASVSVALFEPPPSRAGVRYRRTGWTTAPIHAAKLVPSRTSIQRRRVRGSEPMSLLGLRVAGDSAGLDLVDVLHAVAIAVETLDLFELVGLLLGLRVDDCLRLDVLPVRVQLVVFLLRERLRVTRRALAQRGLGVGILRHECLLVVEVREQRRADAERKENRNGDCRPFHLIPPVSS